MATSPGFTFRPRAAQRSRELTMVAPGRCQTIRYWLKNE